MQNQDKGSENHLPLYCAHCANVQKYEQGKIGLHFLYVEHYGKELKSFMGVLLMADLTGHCQFSQSADFCQKGWDGRAVPC